MLRMQVCHDSILYPLRGNATVKTLSQLMEILVVSEPFLFKLEDNRKIYLVIYRDH